MKAIALSRATAEMRTRQPENWRMEEVEAINEPPQYS